MISLNFIILSTSHYIKRISKTLCSAVLIVLSLSVSSYPYDEICTRDYYESTEQDIVKYLLKSDFEKVIFNSKIFLEVCKDTITSKQKAGILSALATAYNFTNRYEEALFMASNCSKLDRYADSCMFSMGVAYYYLGHIDKAKETFNVLIDTGISEKSISDAKIWLSEIDYIINKDKTSRYKVYKSNAKTSTDAVSYNNKSEKNLIDNPREEARSYGSGFIINEKGEVVTSHHVVSNCINIVVYYSGKHPSNANTIAKDTINDLAVLKTGHNNKKYSYLVASNILKLGADIAAAGFPLQGILASQINITKGNISSLAGMNNNSSLVQITAPVQQGNSGGPLLDNNNNVIGVIVSKLDAYKLAQVGGDIPQNVNFAIKASVVKNFLESNDIKYYVNDKKSVSNHNSNYTYESVVLVECR